MLPLRRSGISRSSSSSSRTALDTMEPRRVWCKTKTTTDCRCKTKTKTTTDCRCRCTHTSTDCRRSAAVEPRCVRRQSRVLEHGGRPSEIAHVKVRRSRGELEKKHGCSRAVVRVNERQRDSGDHRRCVQWQAAQAAEGDLHLCAQQRRGDARAVNGAGVEALAQAHVVVSVKVREDVVRRQRRGRPLESVHDEGRPGDALVEWTWR